jgi:hypothetical protein
MLKAAWFEMRQFVINTDRDSVEYLRSEIKLPDTKKLFAPPKSKAQNPLVSI